MPPGQPIVTTSRGRQFPATPAALIALIINQAEQFLMLSHPKAEGAWEPINGGMDAEETVLEGMYREITEEAGSHVQVHPLGTVHTYTFSYDVQVPIMFSIWYLFVHQSGEIVPGDDMAGSEVQWLSVEEIESNTYDILVPRELPWIYRRARDLYRLWKDQPDVELQPDFNEPVKPKYGKK